MSIKDLIFKNYEEERYDDWSRSHLGASEIGTDCFKKLWLDFRKAKFVKIEGRILRLFESGDYQEPRVAIDLKRIGREVKIELSKNTWCQKKFLESFGVEVFKKGKNKDFSFKANFGHLSGSLDILSKLPEDDEWFNTEVKTFSDERFTRFVKDGIYVSNYQYYCQAQMYMGFKDLSKTILVGVNKNNDDIHTEEISFNKRDFESLVWLAKEVIFNKEIPNNGYFHEDYIDYKTMHGCKFCKYKGICHKNEKCDINCRTCKYAEAKDDGNWYCNLNNKKLTVNKQKKSCKKYEGII